MIIVDTNIWSEPFKSSPNVKIVDWLKAHSAESFITSVTVQELYYGLELLKQKNSQDYAPARILERHISELLNGLKYRTLNYDMAAAAHHGRVGALFRSSGRELSSEDEQIIGIALAHDFSVATRNTKDFEGAGIELLNPWT